MSSVLSRNQVREVDRRAIHDYGMSGLVLMENAGRGTTDVLCRLLHEMGKPQGPVAVVCGKGNNGGDGFVIARHLDLRNVAAKVLLLAEPNELTGDAAANYRILEKTSVPIVTFGPPLDVTQFDAEIAGAAWIVDALLGTGAIGEPKSPYAEAIDRMNASGMPILAVDLPSGLDCDTGEAANHTIRAARTCTFVAAKPGFFVAGPDKYVGQLHVLDIGAPRRLIEEMLAPTQSSGKPGG